MDDTPAEGGGASPSRAVPDWRPPTSIISETKLNVFIGRVHRIKEERYAECPFPPNEYGQAVGAVFLQGSLDHMATFQRQPWYNWAFNFYKLLGPGEQGLGEGEFLRVAWGEFHDMVLDYVQQELEELKTKPKPKHHARQQQPPSASWAEKAAGSWPSLEAAASQPKAKQAPPPAMDADAAGAAGGSGSPGRRQRRSRRLSTGRPQRGRGPGEESLHIRVTKIAAFSNQQLVDAISQQQLEAILLSMGFTTDQITPIKRHSVLDSGDLHLVFRTLEDARAFRVGCWRFKGTGVWVHYWTPKEEDKAEREVAPLDRDAIAAALAAAGALQYMPPVDDDSEVDDTEATRQRARVVQQMIDAAAEQQLMQQEDKVQYQGEERGEVAGTFGGADGAGLGGPRDMDVDVEGASASTTATPMAIQQDGQANAQQGTKHARDSRVLNGSGGELALPSTSAAPLSSPVKSPPGKKVRPGEGAGGVRGAVRGGRGPPRGGASRQH